MASNQPPKSAAPTSNPTSQSRTHTARPPAPALFIAPSQNASSVSLRPPATAGQGSTTTRIPLLRQRSATRGEGDASPNVGGFGDKSSAAGRSGPSSSFLSPNVAASATYSAKGTERGSPLGAELSREPSRTGETVATTAPSAAAQLREKTIAQWRTMQNTLNEIDLTTNTAAPTTGQAVHHETGGLKENFNRIFPPAHARALEDLRRAQIALAQAWARSEAEDEVVEDIDEREMERRADGSRLRTLIDAEDRAMGVVDQHVDSARPKEQKKPETSSKSDQNSDKARANDLAQEKGTKTMLEEETERDIMLARKRRQMNDRYFERVNKGVVDVVSKLEDVANRMRAVEMESKEIWGEELGHAHDKGRRASTSARSA